MIRDTCLFNRGTEAGMTNDTGELSFQQSSFRGDDKWGWSGPIKNYLHAYPSELDSACPPRIKMDRWIPAYVRMADIGDRF